MTKKSKSTVPATLSIGSAMVNGLGLNKRQATLYRYMLECCDKSRTVEMKTVAEIYYTHIASRHKCQVYLYFDEPSKKHIYNQVTPKEYVDYLEKQAADHGWTTINTFWEARGWLKSNLGSFVMRGLLTAIPKFRPTEIEEAKP